MKVELQWVAVENGCVYQIKPNRARHATTMVFAVEEEVLFDVSTRVFFL